LSLSGGSGANALGGIANDSEVGTSSGSVSLSSSDAGVVGVSGSLSLSTGIVTSGNSGLVSISSGSSGSGTGFVQPAVARAINQAEPAVNSSNQGELVQAVNQAEPAGNSSNQGETTAENMNRHFRLIILSQLPDEEGFVSIADAPVYAEKVIEVLNQAHRTDEDGHVKSIMQCGYSADELNKIIVSMMPRIYQPFLDTIFSRGFNLLNLTESEARLMVLPPCARPAAYLVPAS
jgi:hypothetical protein